jgi:MFS family permease
MSEPTRVRQRVLAFTLTLTAIAYLDRVCISMAAPAMKEDLGISDVQMGWVFSAFTFAYALFEVPSGWLADRFGARLMLTRIVVWWSAMTAATGAVLGVGSLIVVRFLFGMGEAGCFPSMARAYGRWLPVRERGGAFGLTLMAGALGGALTQPLVVALLELVHWRHTFMLFGIVGIAWAVAWFWWFRDEPHGHPAVNAAELALIGCEPPEPHRQVPWAKLLRDRNLVALCGMYLFAIYGWYFYLTWLPTYLLRAAASTSSTSAGSRHCRCSASPPACSSAAGSATCWRGAGAYASAAARRARSAYRSRRWRSSPASSRRPRSAPPCSSPPPPGWPRSASAPPGRSASRSAAGMPVWSAAR